MKGLKTKHGLLQAKTRSVLAGFAVIASAAIFTLALAGCDGGGGGGGKTLASIEITTQPTKTTYTVGDSALETAGMVVTATYSDGSTAAVTGWTTSGFDSSAAVTSQTITVSYKEGEVTQTATFTVTIEAALLETKTVSITIKTSHSAITLNAVKISTQNPQTREWVYYAGSASTYEPVDISSTPKTYSNLELYRNINSAPPYDVNVTVTRGTVKHYWNGDGWDGVSDSITLLLKYAYDGGKYTYTFGIEQEE